MCANPLGDVPRLVSYKPNDYLQITFHNECAKRKMYKNHQDRRRTTNQNVRCEIKPNESNFMCRNINHTNNSVSYFNCPICNWERHSPSTCRNAEQPFSSRLVNFHPSNNTSRFSNVAGEFGVRHRGVPPSHQQQPKQPTAYRRSGHLTGPSTNNNNTSHHYADANGFRGQTSAAASRHRQLPLSHPSRFLEEPYRDYKQPSSSSSAGVFRTTRRTPAATTPPDIHQPPPSVMFKQRQLQRASCQGNATTFSGAQGRTPRHQPPPPPAQQQQQQKQWENDRAGDRPAVNGVVGGQDSGLQRRNQMGNFFNRHRENSHPVHVEFNRQRGKFSTSSRRFRGPQTKQGQGNNHHPGYYDYEAGQRKGNLTGRKQGLPSPPPPFSDEYIDDFTPEDLVKYNLQIDMENFTVQSPLISDPILNVPLSTTWLTDDLYQTVTASSLEQNQSQFSWHKPGEEAQKWTRADEYALEDNPETLHIDSTGRQNGSIARTRSLDHLAHSSRLLYDRVNSCPGTLGTDPGHGEADRHQASSGALGSTTSLPGSISVYQQEHRSPLFQSRSCPANLHVC